MATYYVDSILGNDSNSGTYFSPWKTNTRVNSITLVAGDRVLFNRGQTFSGALAPKGSGIDRNRIIFDAYGDAEPLPKIVGSATSSALYIPLSSDPAAYLEFHNLYFSGGTSVVCRVYTHHTLMEDCEVADGVKYGIASSAGATTPVGYIHDNTFRRNKVHHNGWDGIVSSVTHPSYPYNILIEDNEVNNNGTVNPASHGIYTHSGCTIRRNKTHHNAKAGIKCNSEFGIIQEYLPVVYDNESWENGLGICVAHHYLRVWNNLVYSNDYNLFWESDVSYAQIYFNTLVNSRKPAYSRGMDFNGNLNRSNNIRNNLIIQDRAIVGREVVSRGRGGLISEVPPVNDIDYNIYYQDGNDTSRMFIQDTGSSLGWNSWRALAGSPDVHSINLHSVPEFVSRYTDLHPALNGNLQGKGIAITGYEIDKDGKQRLNPPTPGCFEVAYAQTSSPSNSVSSSVSPSVSSSVSKSASSSVSKSASSSDSKSASSSMSASKSPSNSSSASKSPSSSKSSSTSSSDSNSISPSSSTSKSQSSSESNSVSASSSVSDSISPSASVSPSPNAITDLTQIVTELNASINYIETELNNVRQNIIDINKVIVLLEQSDG